MWTHLRRLVVVAVAVVGGSLAQSTTAWSSEQDSCLPSMSASAATVEAGASYELELTCQGTDYMSDATIAFRFEYEQSGQICTLVAGPNDFDLTVRNLRAGTYEWVGLYAYGTQQEETSNPIEVEVTGRIKGSASFLPCSWES